MAAAGQVAQDEAGGGDACHEGQEEEEEDGEWGQGWCAAPVCVNALDNQKGRGCVQGVIRRC